MSSMKFIGQKIAVAAVILCAVPAYADEPAQIKNCTWCHGTSAQGVSTAPRLAGQRQQYIEKQLAGFHQHTRDNPWQFMWGAVTALSPHSARELATYFSTLPPKAANGGDPDYSYLKRRLAQWGAGYHALGTYPMPRVARSLSTGEVDALASYLSFIK
jgi:cytochrome c553